MSWHLTLNTGTVAGMCGSGGSEVGQPGEASLRERGLPVTLEIGVLFARVERSWQSACDRGRKASRHGLPSWSAVHVP